MTLKRNQLRLQRGLNKFSKGDDLLFQYLESIMAQLDFITQEISRMKQPNYNNPNRMNEIYNLAHKGLIGNYKLPAPSSRVLPKQGPPQSVIS